jgi:hypothetical protein
MLAVFSETSSAFDFNDEAGPMEEIEVNGQRPGEWVDEFLNNEFRRFEEEWQQSLHQLAQVQLQVASLQEAFEDTRDNEPKAETREQCKATSNEILQRCEQGPLDVHYETLQNCLNVDWSSTVGSEVDFRLVFSVHGSATATVRNYDQCKDVSGAKREVYLNNCDINHARRIIMCPPN